MRNLWMAEVVRYGDKPYEIFNIQVWNEGNDNFSVVAFKVKDDQYTVDEIVRSQVEGDNRAHRVFNEVLELTAKDARHQSSSIALPRANQ